MPPGRLATAFGAPAEDIEARRRALADPGPTWKAWFYQSFLKLWIPFSFFIVDLWIVAAWIDPLTSLSLFLMIVSLAAAVYLEVLAFQVLYYEPPSVSRSTHTGPGWRLVHPVPWGRWTREGVAARGGAPIVPAEPQPDPREFL